MQLRDCVTAHSSGATQLVDAFRLLGSAMEILIAGMILPKMSIHLADATILRDHSWACALPINFSVPIVVSVS